MGQERSRRSCPCRENRWLQMSDPYFNAIQEQWPYIRALYMTYESKKPIILYDIQDKKIYAYPGRIRCLAQGCRGELLQAIFRRGFRRQEADRGGARGEIARHHRSKGFTPADRSL